MCREVAAELERIIVDDLETDANPPEPIALVEVLHALVDSLYVHKSGAGRDDYEHLTRVIESRTKLPLALSVPVYPA